MAIVKLNKLSIIGLETEREAVLAGLQALGAAELSDPSESRVVVQIWKGPAKLQIAAIQRDDAIKEGDMDGYFHFMGYGRGTGEKIRVDNDRPVR